MATLKDVAQRAGVTVTTVSRMLNDRARISEKTRLRIQAAMEELDYHPNELARSLAKKNSHFIGLIVPSADNFFFSCVIASVERHASASGYKLLLCVSNHEIQKEKEFFSMLLGSKVAGIILASHTQNLEEFADVDAPVITIDRTVSPRIPSACADNHYGGCIAAEHLIARGCRRLLYVSGSAHLDMDANKRYLGFQDACRRLGVSKPSAVDAAERQFVRMDYQETVAAIFRNHPDVDGILCSNDVIAAEIIQYCRRHEIDIPGRLKLIGYDDTRLASLCSPQLTTIHQPVEDICRYAVESIIHASSGRVVPTCAVFPVTLVERETT